MKARALFERTHEGGNHPHAGPSGRLCTRSARSAVLRLDRTVPYLIVSDQLKEPYWGGITIIDATARIPECQLKILLLIANAVRVAYEHCRRSACDGTNEQIG